MEGKSAIVIGGAGYLGSEMAATLAELGASVCVASRTERNCRSVRDKLPVQSRTQAHVALECDVTEDHETVFFVKNLKTSEMLSSFKSASSVKIRINDKTCGAGTYEFNMTGGTSAFDFVVKQ